MSVSATFFLGPAHLLLAELLAPWVLDVTPELSIVMLNLFLNKLLLLFTSLYISSM